MRFFIPWIVRRRAWHKLMVFLVISGCTVLDSPSVRVHAGAPSGTPRPTTNPSSTTVTPAAAGKPAPSRNWLAGLFQHKPKDNQNAAGPQGDGPLPDATAGLAGQPYFLPRGLIHLVVKPTSSGAGGAAAPSGGNTNTSNTTPAPAAPLAFTINGTVTQSGAAGGDNSSSNKSSSATADTGTTAITYQITADVVYVPDMTCGPFLAHYRENPLFSENVTIGVTADGLLTTATSTSTDQTPQVISNIVQTGIDILSFGAQLPLGVGAAPLTGKSGGAMEALTAGLPKSIKYVKYKRLDIDVVFDPFDKQQVDNVKDLFEPILQPDPAFQSESSEASPASTPGHPPARKKKVSSAKTKTVPVASIPGLPAPVADGPIPPPTPDTPTAPATPVAPPAAPVTPATSATATTTSETRIDPAIQNDRGGQVYYISPFKFDIATRLGAELQISTAPQNPHYSAQQNGLPIVPPGGTLPDLRPKLPKNQLGLMFREPTPVQITLTQNSEQFRTVASRVLAFNLERLKELHTYPATKLADEVTAVDNLISLIKADAPDPNNTSGLQGDLPAFRNIINRLIGAVGNFGPDFQSAKDYLETLRANYTVSAMAGTQAAATANAALTKTLAADAKSLQTFLDTLSKDLRIFPNGDTMTAYQNEVTYERNALLTSVPMPSRSARLIKSVPNPYRVVAIETRRRPFVANSGLNLTISNGMLTQLNINKQSEVLGFTQIPLNIAQMLVSVPNNLLTLRTQNLTDKSALVNAQNSLVNAQDSSQLQQNTALLNAQAAQLNAQAAKLKAQAALNSAMTGK